MDVVVIFIVIFEERIKIIILNGRLGVMLFLLNNVWYLKLKSEI